MSSLHQRPFMHLLTTLLLVHVAVHSSHGLSVTFDWSSNVTTRQVLQLRIGDELILQCVENFVSDIVQQTLAQVDACNSSIDNPNAEDPASVGSCFGGVSFVPIELLTSSGVPLPAASVYQAGENYYYTSYSAVNATTAIGGGFFDGTAGGQCSAGLQLEIQILNALLYPLAINHQKLGGTLEKHNDRSTYCRQH
ncbi:uncharacterized protein LOC135344414 isoform X2 [Halichondria panicea]|uniref:uncharacterized protein LOC135344414 isoform X2 n=1 Tax=Halichondria panicea TaxID=6063 RepID=UPI00312BA4A7